MVIGLLGTGKVGALIEKLAHLRGHTIGYTRSKKKETGSLASCDVLIDFSNAEALHEHLELAIHHQKPLVIGTTGWNVYEEEVKKKVEAAGIGCIASPNFSVGVQLFMQIVREAVKRIAPFEEYDASGFEVHHQHKLDAPSGTAKALQKELNAHYPKASFSSLRVGEVPGEHTVIFDSLADTITLQHRARSREGFALGALRAAEWIKDKKGYYRETSLYL